MLPPLNYLFFFNLDYVLVVNGHKMGINYRYEFSFKIENIEHVSLMSQG